MAQNLPLVTKASHDVALPATSELVYGRLQIVTGSTAHFRGIHGGSNDTTDTLNNKHVEAELNKVKEVLKASLDDRATEIIRGLEEKVTKDVERRVNRMALAVVAIVGGVVVSAGFAAMRDINNSVISLQDNIINAQKTIQEANDKINEADKRIEAKNKDLDAAKEKLDRAINDLNAKTTDLAAAELLPNLGDGHLGQAAALA